MENKKKEINKYKAESIEDQKYRDLFEEISKCGIRDWIEKDGKNILDLKHPVYPSYSRLDFIHLHDFLIDWVSQGKHRKLMSEAKAKERKQNFRNELNKRAAGLAEVFRLGKNRNIQSGRIKIGIQTAAEFLDVELIHLLAEFLKDCESKKILLLLHSEYKDTIENFLREAPKLVRQLESESARPIAQDYQKQSSEQKTTESGHGIDRVKGAEKWLDPYNFDALPLVGRDDERKSLDKFIIDDGQFKIWAIVGPSGAGKTRLASQWAYESSALKGWDRRFLHKEDRIEPEKWSNWIPDKSTLLIIDYMYGFEAVIQKLMNHRFKPDPPKIRLLLIDHVFSEPLHSDKRWGFSGDGSSLNRNEKYFYDTKPLDLRQTLNQEAIIKSIIAHRAGIDREGGQVDIAHKYLQETQGAYHSLFAALVGDAIKSGKNFAQWNRRELISYYLSGQRLPWDNGKEGRWASHFIAAATARRGMLYSDLIKATGNYTSSPEHFDGVNAICQKVVADNNAEILKPFEPDILGESFFLKFLQFLENSPAYQKEFRQIFMAGNEDTQIEDAIEFIAFIHRLTRNLLNDDQKVVGMLWKVLFEFLNPLNFEKTEPLKWAVSAGLIEAIDTRQDHIPKDAILTWLNKIEPSVLYRVSNASLLENSLVYSMGYFELVRKYSEKTLNLEEMDELFGRFLAKRAEIEKETPLIIASFYGFNKITNELLKDHRVNIEAKDIAGQNALMTASLMGHTDTVRLLLSEGADIEATDNEGHTALMYASRDGRIDTVRLLLGEGVDIEATDNEGSTALMHASWNGYADMVRLLLSEGADIEAADNEGDTALIRASWNGNADTVRLLLGEGADIEATNNEGDTALIRASWHGNADTVRVLLVEGADIEATDNEGGTALMHASGSGHADIVRLLLGTGADIKASGNGGHTALMHASWNGRADMVKLLLSEGADIGAIDNEDHTALMHASWNGHADTVRVLLGEGVDIEATDNEGSTALMHASGSGSADTVRLLLDDGADIDATDKEGRTALRWAYQHDHVEIIKLLLIQEAQIDIADNNRCTILSIAKADNNKEIVQLLIEYGAEK